MVYTTTKCAKCGYKTRNFESNVPTVQLGMPVVKCPKCGELIIDPIATEYEFMTENERKKFTTDAATGKATVGNVIFILLGIAALIGGPCMGGAYIVIGIIVGIAAIGIGAYQIIQNQKAADSELLEQWIYASLKRTENKNYVRFIEQAYRDNNIRRKYFRYPLRWRFKDNYSRFEDTERHKALMRDFAEIMTLIDAESATKSSEISIHTP